MIKIQYDATNGIALPDGLVRTWVNNVVFAFKHGHSGQHLVANDSIINELRIRVARGELTTNDIEFVFDNGSTVFVVPLDKRGSFPLMPAGFCDFTSNQALELLSAMLGKEDA
jgi:hypothetical protein